MVLLIYDNDSTDYVVLNEESLVVVDDDLDESNRDPLLLSKNLKKIILRLKGENLIDEKEVNYSNLIKSDLFQKDYVKLASSLKSVNLDSLISSNDSNENDANILAFFINVYNALTIHALAYLHQSDDLMKNEQSDGQEVSIIKSYSKFWSKMAYKIDRYTFSLDDIEHGVLRSNRIHPSSNKKFFDEQTDERSKFIVKKFTPFIHFALNCGAKSCPPISFYTPDNVYKGLTLAATGFCSNEIQIDLNEASIEVSRLFLWYKNDFIYDIDLDIELADDIETQQVENRKLVLFFKKILAEDPKQSELIGKLLANKKIEVKYSTYNWSINKK